MAKQKGWNVDGVFNNDIVGGNRTPGDKLQRWDVVRVFSEGLAAAAGLVMAKSAGVPAVIIHGYRYRASARERAANIIRPAGEDLFR